MKIVSMDLLNKIKRAKSWWLCKIWTTIWKLLSQCRLLGLAARGKSAVKEIRFLHQLVDSEAIKVIKEWILQTIGYHSKRIKPLWISRQDHVTEKRILWTQIKIRLRALKNFKKAMVSKIQFIKMNSSTLTWVLLNLYFRRLKRTNFNQIVIKLMTQVQHLLRQSKQHN